VPVTAVEQPVGLMLDKSGLGNHATQATTTNRPVYSRRVNLLTKTDAAFPELPWNMAATTASGSRITATAVNSNHIRFQAYAHVPNVPVRYRVQVAKKIGFGFFQLCYSNHARVKCTVNLETGEFVVNGADAVVTVTDTGTGRWEVTITGSNPAAATTGYFNMGPTTSLSEAVNSYQEPVFTGTGEYIDVYEPDLRLATDAHLPYQRVNTDTDYDADPAKFPAYLRWDGVDDAMQTGNIDFTSTDKMTVWAGVSRFGAGVQSISELSANVGANAAAWWLESGGASVDAFRFASRGSAALGSAVSPAVVSPASVVLTGQGDIAAPESRLRVAGAAYLSTAAQGTGNYGNYPLYIGSRAGTANYFNGRLYSLIIRGAQSSLSQIEATEAYIKQKMRLP